MTVTEIDNLSSSPIYVDDISSWIWIWRSSLMWFASIRIESIVLHWIIHTVLVSVTSFHLNHDRILGSFLREHPEGIFHLPGSVKLDHLANHGPGKDRCEVYRSMSVEFRLSSKSRRDVDTEGEDTVSINTILEIRFEGELRRHISRRKSGHH